MGKIIVDGAKLRASAEQVRGAGRDVEQAAGAGIAGATANLRDALHESATAGVAVELGRQIAEVAADLATALHGLSEGLEKAASNFHEVDVVYSRVAGGN